MGVKSLVLDCVMAVIAVSSAHAADLVPETAPEPADYVKVCDVYGAGYFYIPGTETCLRVGGYLRYDISNGNGGRVLDGRSTRDVLTGDVQQTWNNNARFDFKTWTGQETELGTLKTYTETRFNYPNGGPSATTLNFAWMQLGGLRVGKDESVYDTFIGYAGNVVQDTIIPYGIKDTNIVSYYFDGRSGFTGVVSFEQGSGATGTIDSYVPHVVGGLKYARDWGAVTGVIAYDSNYEEMAGKIRVDVNAMKDLTLFAMVGYGGSKNAATSFYKPWTGNFAVWGGGTYTVNKEVALNAQLSFTDFKDFAMAANLAYTIVPGYTITGELDYFDNFKTSNSGAMGGIVRFQRSF